MGSVIFLVQRFLIQPSILRCHPDCATNKQVKNIILCGHYECGGVRAAMANNDHGLVENWVMGVKEVARMHQDELMVSGARG